MPISAQIDKDLKQAMVGKDELAVTVLRMLKSAMHNQEIAKRKKGLTDEEITQVIASQAKQRQEAIAAFGLGGREELKAKEEKELKIIAKYLPEQLSGEAITKIVQEVITSMPEAERNFGAVMKRVMGRVKGQASGQAVSQAVKASLAK